MEARHLPRNHCIPRRLRAVAALCLAVPLAAWPAPPGAGSAPDAYHLVSEFSGPHSPSYAISGVIEGTDGRLYGNSFWGGIQSGGTIYRIAHLGGPQVIAKLDQATGMGSRSEFVEGADGNLYGTAAGGGANWNGTVFRLSRDGRITVLHDFGVDYGSNSDGAYPLGLCLGPDGNFYGVTQLGGSMDQGVAFRITPAGEFTTLHDFSYSTDGMPIAALILGPDGAFYGTGGGGANDGGTVFRMTVGGEVTVLYSFDYYQPPRPFDVVGLAANPNGDLFGATYGGGTHNFGTVFKLSMDGTLTVLHSFEGADGLEPLGPVTWGPDGRLYGTTQYGGAGFDGSDLLHGAVFTMLPDGSGFRLLHTFQGPPTDGAAPMGRLLPASDGRLYGTTTEGGSSDQGTVFSISPR
jgi:uncharacterized repeat protein (TIGR03803 family)